MILLKKNILLLIHNISNGGAEKVACDIADMLSKNNNMYIAVMNLEKNSYETDINIINLNVKRNFFGIINGIKKVKKIKKIYKIDTTISFLIHANLINVFSKYKDKTIITIHNIISRQNKGKIIEKLHVISCKKADKIVAVSEGIKQDQIKKFKLNKDSIDVIYNPCNIEKIIELSNEKFNDNEIYTKNYIINIGRLIPQKNQEELIKKFAKISKKYEDLKLLILGEGFLKNSLEELTKKLNLEEKVIFLGFVKNPYKYIANAKAFVLTSDYEGLPTVILESIACKTPIVSYDCFAGPREILYDKEKIDYDYDKKINKIKENEFSILTDSNNFENSVLKVLKNNKYKNYISKNYNNILYRFNFENIAKRWEEII